MLYFICNFDFLSFLIFYCYKFSVVWKLECNPVSPKEINTFFVILKNAYQNIPELTFKLFCPTNSQKKYAVCFKESIKLFYFRFLNNQDLGQGAM